MVKIRNTFPQFNEEKNNRLLADGRVVLKEPKNVVMSMVYSIPLMIFLSLITVFIIGLFSPLTLTEFGIQHNNFSLALSFTELIAGIILIYMVIYIHEIIHLIFVPDFLHSEKTFLGLTWFGGYAYTEEEITKERYLVIGCMPFLLISVLFVVISGSTGSLTPVMKLMCIANALGSSVDFFNNLLVIKQVPDRSTMVMNGPVTYYKAV
jgi:hypothetical protein